MPKLYDEFQVTSYLSDNNATYIEELYESFLHNPAAVSDTWRHYFETLYNGGAQTEISHKKIRQQFAELAKHPKIFMPSVVEEPRPVKQESVDALITSYRRFGHLNAKLDPLGTQPPMDRRLTLEHFGLSKSDLDTKFKTRGILDNPYATLKEIHETLCKCYCGTIGIEFSRISHEQEREWLRQKAEHYLPYVKHDAKLQREILKKLIAAEGMEKFLEAKYPGQKRFSIEGADSLIPMIDELAKRARFLNVHEFVIGMAHRGRLNVLLNIMGKSPKELYSEFDGTKEYGLTTGDVKYHYGFSSDVKTDAGPLHLSLAFNPSHLEFINPVVMGSVRARQERDKSKRKHDYAMAVLIHGDASFAGQGIIMETLNMSQTRAYHVGGTIHIVVNNQIGFTITDPHDARSSHYCTDIARMIDAPVFHVNGDDPDAVLAVARVALDYRMTFHKDIVIDLVCYRRHGHQEVDEPRATQPLMYKKIDKQASAKTLYVEKLLQANVITEQEVTAWEDDYRAHLDEGRQVVETLREGLCDHYAANWTPFIGQDSRMEVDTSVPQERIIALAKKLEVLPEGFTLQKYVQMIMDSRKKMTEGKMPLDWGYAEIMAYATLLTEGYPIRLSGEDSRRGTFFHRHAFLFDQVTGEEYMPLAHLGQEAHAQIYDSLLAETGPMGFEYGYSTADPQALVIWEAQFGDFVNVGQVIIDQFLSSAWQKWNRLSGVVFFLPHGNEGMGPEHSSARLERFLQLCAQDNIQVFVPTTPAQIFHLLRRQVLRPYRKPLIVMTPKSLLRHKLAVSSLEDLAKGQLQLLIPEVDGLEEKKVKRVVICCGKIFYELLAKRREKEIKDIAIIRIEQMYPFPYEQLTEQLQRYSNAKEVIWCQEEPKNQGGWFCTRDRLLKCLPEGRDLQCITRKPMAAPASGYAAYYKKSQKETVYKTLELDLSEE